MQINSEPVELILADNRHAQQHAIAVEQNLLNWVTQSPTVRRLKNILNVYHGLRIAGDERQKAPTNPKYRWMSGNQPKERPERIIAVAYMETYHCPSIPKTPIGFCLLHGPEMYLYVLENFRRKGVASSLIRLIQEHYSAKERVMLIGRQGYMQTLREKTGIFGRNIAHTRRLDNKRNRQAKAA